MKPPLYMLETWRRHDLLRVKSSAWPRILSRRPELAIHRGISQWAELGRPLIVCRRAVRDETGYIPAAFPLPPDCNKLRVALQVAPEEINERVPAQTLRAMCEETPLRWRPTVTSLLTLADETGLEPLVFGSLLWQRLTGLSYLSATSDLDLLWPVADSECAARLVTWLAIIEGRGSVRLDGELILPDGGGVQWRELLSGASDVLVKSMTSVQLRPIAGLFKAFAWEEEFQACAQI